MNKVAIGLFGLGIGFGVLLMLASSGERVRNVKRRRSRTGTKGVYRQRGPNSVRYGQSIFIERQAYRSARENEECLGPNPKIEVVLESSNEQERLWVEEQLIKQAREEESRGGPRVCNLVDR